MPLPPASVIERLCEGTLSVMQCRYVPQNKIQGKKGLTKPRVHTNLAKELAERFEGMTQQMKRFQANHARTCKVFGAQFHHWCSCKTRLLLLVALIVISLLLCVMLIPECSPEQSLAVVSPHLPVGKKFLHFCLAWPP